MDGAREVDLLAGEIRFRVVGEQLGQNEQRVERGPQLVRHVRQELALVLRGDGELAGFLFQLSLGALHLLILALDLFVLRLQQSRFLFQLLVGLLQLFLLRLEQLFRSLQRLGLLFQPFVRLGQLFLLRLQLFGERLRLRQELFRPHVRLDGVDDHANRLGELVEQRDVGLGEAAERGQLHHREDLPFEDDGKDHDVGRPRLAQSGVDLDVIGRRVGDQDALLLECGLTDQTLADPELLVEMFPLLVGVGRRQPEPLVVTVVPGVHDVEDTVCGSHHRRQFAEDHLGDRLQVLLSLHHPGELGQVGLQPVLLGVPRGGLAEVANHLVDVALQRSQLSFGLNGDVPAQIALGHGGGDVGDGAHLRGEVRSELVDVVGQIAPGA